MAQLQIRRGAPGGADLLEPDSDTHRDACGARGGEAGVDAGRRFRRAVGVRRALARDERADREDGTGAGCGARGEIALNLTSSPLSTGLGPIHYSVGLENRADGERRGVEHGDEFLRIDSPEDQRVALSGRQAALAHPRGDALLLSLRQLFEARDGSEL